MRLVLIFRCDLLRYAVKLIMIPLFVNLFLSFLVHILTSKSVFAKK